MSDSALIIQLIVRKGLVSKEQLRILEEGNERIDPNGLFEELVKKGFVERKTVYRMLADEFAMRFVDFTELDLPKEPDDYLQETIAAISSVPSRVCGRFVADSYCESA